MSDVQRADAAARRRALILLLVAATMGTIALAWIHSQAEVIEEMAEVDLDAAIERTVTMVRIVAALTSLPLVLFAAYAYRLAMKTRASSRFPPDGVPVVRDTPVLREAAAQRRANLLFASAVVLLIAAIAIPIVMERALTLLR